MKLTERVEYEFKPMDMGNVMHEALESFAEEVRKMDRADRTGTE